MFVPGELQQCPACLPEYLGDVQDMRKRIGITSAFMLAAALAFVPVHAADDNTFAVFGAVSDFDPEQTGAGGGVAASWEWTDTVFFTAETFIVTADDVDRGRVLFGGEWQDRIGRVTGYMGLQAGADVYDSDAGSNEDAFARAYYDLGWQVFGSSELRLGIGYDTKSDVIERDTAVRAAWITSLRDDMAFFIRGELYDNEKNVFAGVEWGY